jgi:hypothetical protein
VFLFTAYMDVVLGPRASASAPNRWVGAASFGAGQCQQFAGKLVAPIESGEEPKSVFWQKADTDLKPVSASEP